MILPSILQEKLNIREMKPMQVPSHVCCTIVGRRSTASEVLRNPGRTSWSLRELVAWLQGSMELDDSISRGSLLRRNLSTWVVRLEKHFNRRPRSQVFHRRHQSQLPAIPVASRWVCYHGRAASSQGWHRLRHRPQVVASAYQSQVYCSGCRS